MPTHSSILVWRISWTEEPGGLQSMKFPGQSTEVVSLSFLQGMFPTQGLNPGLPLLLLLLLSRFSHVQLCATP